MKSIQYEQALAQLQGLGKFGINLGLQRISKLLSLLGNPQEQISCIHIGGTNGKGSTGAMISAVLRKAGYRVGAYTSPHLESYTERFTINGQPIDEELFARFLSRVLSKYDQVQAETGEAPTEFEVLTAMAFLYFAEIKVDVLILEVGLGGDIDSTNVIRQPLLSIITNVTLDHCDHLGSTPRAIAEKKSGIIKEGCPLITASTDPEVLEVLRQVARDRQAPIYEVYQEASWELLREIGTGQLFNLRTRRKERESLFLSLQGCHQLVNAATAVMAIDVLATAGWQIPEEAYYEGLAQVSWPGRLETVREQPRVVLDGAHNYAGLQALARWLEKSRERAARVILVIGMLDDKEHRGVQLLEPLADEIIVTQPPSARAGNWERVAEYFSGEKPLHKIAKPREAVAKALELAAAQDLVLITGSLFLIGEVRKHLVR